MANKIIALQGRKSVYGCQGFVLFCATALVLVAIILFPEVSYADDGQLTLFLNGPQKATLDISFEIEAVSIVDEDGISRQVTEAPLIINTAEVAGRQLLLGELDLPEGKYTMLRFIVKEASIAREKGRATLALPAEGIVDLRIAVRIESERNVTLFILWEADSSVKDGYLFAPSLVIRGEAPELVPLLVFVSNEDSGNVSVINRQEEEVVATIKTGKKPRGIDAGHVIDRLRVYVANSGSDSISIINPAENKVDQEVPIRFGREPEDVAAAEVSRGREVVFVANYGSDTVSVVDAHSYEEIDQIQVGNGPIAVAVDPPRDKFLSSRFLSPSDIDVMRDYSESFINVYVANKDSREISIIRWNISGNNFERPASSIEVEWTPISLSVDPQRAKLYVTNYDSNRLSIIDIVQVIKGNTTGAVTTIGNLYTSSTGVVADPSLDRIYLLKESSDEIVLIRPPRETPSVLEPTLSPIVGVISVGDSPRSLLIDAEGRKLYVVNRGEDSVSVVDKTTRRQEKVIPVGKKPYGIATFE